MIDLIDVTAGYRNRPIIKNFSLRLERGNFVVLIGPNGAGKSTLLRVMAGLLPINRGMRHLDGKDYERYSRRLFSQRVTYLPQDRNLSLPYTAGEIVLFGAYARHGLWETLGESEQRRAREALKQVGAAALFDRPVTELSGGERQRVLLARSLLRVGRLTCLTSQRQNLILLKKNGSCIPFRDFPGKGPASSWPFMICPLPHVMEINWSCLEKREPSQPGVLPRSLLRAYFQGPMAFPFR